MLSLLIQIARLRPLSVRARQRSEAFVAALCVVRRRVAVWHLQIVEVREVDVRLCLVVRMSSLVL